MSLMILVEILSLSNLFFHACACIIELIRTVRTMAYLFMHIFRTMTATLPVSCVSASRPISISLCSTQSADRGANQLRLHLLFISAEQQQLLFHLNFS